MTEEQETKEIKETEPSGIPPGTRTSDKVPSEEGKQKSDEKQEPNSNIKEDTSKKPSEILDKDNIIYIGIKPFMNYVTGVVMQFKTKGQKEVIVSARGKFISKAVDVVEVAKRTFLKEEDIQVKDIKISSEAFENKEGRRIHVSAIAIILVNPEK